jgi:hypothetical protein
MVNEQEEAREEMFDSIQSKLEDKTYFEEVTNISIMSGSQKEEIPLSEEAKKMTDDDVKCYESRYQDLAGLDAKSHFSKFGSPQGRLSSCA